MPPEKVRHEQEDAAKITALERREDRQKLMTVDQISMKEPFLCKRCPGRNQMVKRVTGRG